MAAPTFVGYSTGATDAGGAWTATGSAGTSGNIVILQVLQDGATGGAVTLDSATNIENLAGTDNAWTSIGSFAHGSTHIQHLWIGRLINTSAPTATGSNSTSEDLYWRFCEFSNVSTGTTLAAVLEQNGTTTPSTTSGTSDTIADAGVTSTGPDRLFLNCVSVNDDNVLAAFTGTPGSWWTYGSNGYYAESSGTDGAIALTFAIRDSDLWSTTIGTGTFGWEWGWGTGGSYMERAVRLVAPATATTATLTISLALKGSPTDSAVIALKSDSGGLPGTTLDSETIAYTSLTSDFQEFNLSLSASITAGNVYWLHFYRTGAGSATNCYKALQLQASWYYGRSTDFEDWAYGGAGPSWVLQDNNLPALRFVSDSFSAGAGTIDGGTYTMSASDGWGVVGFALIGTTTAAKSLLPRPHRPTRYLIRR